MSRQSTGPRWFRKLPVAALAWLFLVGLLIVEFWPDLPTSKSRWLLFIVVGPPLYILAEAFSSWLFSPEHGNALLPRRFSIVRVLIAVPVVAVVLGLYWFLSWILTKS